MASKSNIEWTGHTWNPLAGCSVLTSGCKRCYAMKMAARLDRMGQQLYAGLTKPSKAGPVWTGEMRLASKRVLGAPLDRKKPTTYFVNSMSDLFHENVPDEWILDILTVMAIASQHTFQVLTKRADRMRRFMSQPDLLDQVYANWFTFSGGAREVQTWPLPNVWLGVSTERQQEADERIPHLLQTPAAVRFISAEPLLGPIDLTRIHEWFETPEGARVDMWESALNGKRFDMWAGDDEDPMQPGHPKLDWVIVGGESGAGYREMDLAWVNDICWACKEAGVPFFFKQMAGKKPIPDALAVREMPVVA